MLLFPTLFLLVATAADGLAGCLGPDDSSVLLQVEALPAVKSDALNASGRLEAFNASLKQRLANLWNPRQFHKDPFDDPVLVHQRNRPLSNSPKAPKIATAHRLQVRHYRFPLTEESGYHFVGSASFMLYWVDMRIHFYDIAMYLVKSSDLWKTSGPHEKELQQMLGQVRFHMVMHSRMVSRKALAALVDSLELFAVLRHMSNYSEVLQQYKRCYLKGPEVKPGDHLTLQPTRSYVVPAINGKVLCNVSSDQLGILVMEHYLGNRSDFPEFRDNVFSQLSVGQPHWVTQPAFVNAQMRTPWWVFLLFVMLGIGICVGGLLLYHFCCRKTYATQ